MRGERLHGSVLVHLTAEEARWVGTLIQEIDVTSEPWSTISKVLVANSSFALASKVTIPVPAATVPVVTSLYGIAYRPLLPTVQHRNLVSHLRQHFPKDCSNEAINRFSSAAFEGNIFYLLCQLYGDCTFLNPDGKRKRPDLAVEEHRILVECKNLISSVGATGSIEDVHLKVLDAHTDAREQLLTEDPDKHFEHFVVVGLPEGIDKRIADADVASQQASLRWLYGVPIRAPDAGGTVVQEHLIPDPGSLVFSFNTEWRHTQGPNLHWFDPVFLYPPTFDIPLTKGQREFYNKLDKGLPIAPGVLKRRRDPR